MGAASDTLYRIARPALFALPAETAHHLVAAGLGIVGRTSATRALLASVTAGDDRGLAVERWGVRFANPLGMAAGFDKAGHLVDVLGALGFGHVEVGTVTPEPQPGNPGPRIFRLPDDRALLNRMGFPSEGIAGMQRALARRAAGGPVLGISIGKNKATPPERAPEDYEACYRALADRADYLAVNVSSPNTPGLRDLGVGEALGALLAAVARARDEAVAAGERRVPVLVKLAPDLADADLDDAIDRSRAAGMDGFIAINTTIRRDGLTTPGDWANQAGGISGAPLRDRAVDVVRHVFRRTDGAVPIVGVGGVASGDDALRLIRAGASLVQAYTGFVYGGPSFGATVKDELRRALARDAFADVDAAVGVDA